MTKVLLSIDSASFTGGLLDQICQRHNVALGDLVIVTSLQVKEVPGALCRAPGQALEQGLLQRSGDFDERLFELIHVRYECCSILCHTRNDVAGAHKAAAARGRRLQCSAVPVSVRGGTLSADARHPRGASQAWCHGGRAGGRCSETWRGASN